MVSLVHPAIVAFVALILICGSLYPHSVAGAESAPAGFSGAARVNLAAQNRAPDLTAADHDKALRRVTVKTASPIHASRAAESHI
ncbi:hypothetical protein AAKU55_003229 [Oxalobacteraceae bacterium GrIS 1.11]